MRDKGARGGEEREEEKEGVSAGGRKRRGPYCWSQDSQGRDDFLLCSGERRGDKDSQEKTTSHFSARCSLLPLQKCLQKKIPSKPLTSYVQYILQT